MGVCLSRCGDAQQKAGVVAATISHQNSMENATELHDSNHTLKKFLNRYEIAESRRSLSSPRASLGESLQIPHSSELFSLPDSDADRPSCCISPSPARTSRASVSSRATSSPRSTRNSFSAWGGRFSTDKTISMGCRKKIRPARSSKSLAGDQDLADHQRLVEAIARLERLNGGKNLKLRGSSFCRSDLKKKTQVLSKSRSGEFKRPASYSASGSGYVLQFQPPLQLPKFTACVKNQDPQSHDCGEQSGDSHCCSSTSDLGLITKANCADDPAIMMRPETFSQPKTMGSLVSLAGPIIKQMPLEKSVTNFLKEVENFVSLIEAPRLSLSSEALLERKDSHHEPLIITTHSRNLEDDECAVRLPSYRFEDTDSDEQFTFFEATFADSGSREKESSPVAKSLQSLVQSAAQGIHTSEISHTSEDAVDLPVSDSTIGLTDDQMSRPNSLPVLVVVDNAAGKLDMGTPTETFSISVDPDIAPKRKGKVDAARPALTEIDPNVMPMTKKSPIVNKSPLKMNVLKGLRRGFSRSLDSREGLVTKLDFDIFRNGPTQISTDRLSNTLYSTNTTKAMTSSINCTELGLSNADGQLEQAGCEQEIQ